MSEEKTTLLIIKGTIADLPPDDRAKVDRAAMQIRDLVKQCGDEGFLALALVGAEMAVEAGAESS